MAVLAHWQHPRTDEDRRGSARHVLKLEVETAVQAGPGQHVLIHNLSPRGLLIETAADLWVGAEFELDVPEASDARARVLWRRGQFLGCEFLNPLPRSAVSAALLKNPGRSPEDQVDDEVMLSSGDRFQEAHALPTGTRLWIIIGLAVAAWAVIVGLVLAYRFLSAG
jgi:hypothetical protein